MTNPEALVARARAFLATWGESCANRCVGGIYRANLGRGEAEPVQCREHGDPCSGTRFPLRKPCTWPHNLETVGGNLPCTNCGTGIEEAPGYLSHVTDTSLGEAIRKRGWDYQQDSNPRKDGDYVAIWSGGRLLGEALHDLGLRDLDAKIVAAARGAGMEGL